MPDDAIIAEQSEDELVEQDASDAAEARRLRAELKTRCIAASIPFEELTDADGDMYAQVRVPNGRDHYVMPLYSAQRIKALLSIAFERYVLLGDYAAIASYSDGTIEAGITSLGNSFSSSRSISQIIAGRRLRLLEPIENIEPLVIKNPGGEGQVVLGPSSSTLASLIALTRSGQQRTSLRLEGLRISRHDEAVSVLERVANSLFFQIDLTHDVPLSLARRRRALRRPNSRRDRPEPKSLEFPKGEYDKDPISLYWYGRAAVGMPLLQYLAYYQTIEYYFPSYSQAEARRKVRTILKNPSFRSDRDTDLAKIMLATRSSGQGFGDERSQLRATLNECVEPGALREFLTDNPERMRFLSSKTQGLTDHKIPIANVDADLRNDVADRIYDIRCRIVHTKSGGGSGEVELLLPYSKEADLLYSDIDLIQYVAREVLVSASSTLKL